MAITNSRPNLESLAEDAYLYGLQQVVFYETRYNYTQKEDSDVYAGVNQWDRPNDGRPITADFEEIVTPNATTLYAIAFLDLQDEPVVIEMPESQTGTSRSRRWTSTDSTSTSPATSSTAPTLGRT